MSAKNANNRGSGFAEDEGEVSMSRHLFEHISVLSSTQPAAKKLEVAKSLHRHVGDVDGFLSFSDGDCKTELPSLEWNAHFRKAYTVLLWIRPVLGEEKLTTIAEDNAKSPKRTLYRFSTSHDNASGIGVTVAVGDWRVTSKQPKDGNARDGKRMVQTMLTAYSLPHIPTHTDLSTSLNEKATPYVCAPLELIEDEWAMVGITHVFPYLKRPHWTLCVDGRVTATGELQYPIVDRTPVMQFNSLFENIVKGGAVVMAEDDTPDHKKTASELQEQILTRLKLSLHLASYCLSNDALSSTVQALLAQAGPAMSLQHNGALPTVPPVANWSKGSSLEGPNVGIPIVVHGQALQVQQLAGSCVLWGSAIEARLLGANHPSGYGHKQRIICRMPPQLGTTHSVPRVGLIQPTPPNPHFQYQSDSTDNDFPVSLAISGACSIHHNLSDYLLHSPNVANVDTQMYSCTKHFSLLMEAQSLDSHLLLPFFLALPPAGKIWELQESLYQDSLRQLFALYSDGGKCAAAIIDLLTASIRSGGGRWHEQLLQNGTFHVLASTLRQSLVRAQALSMYTSKTLDDFLASRKNKPIVDVRMAGLPTTPSKIPQAIVDACCNLLDACCGTPCPLLEDLPPSMQIQRTSDLALTSLFAIALDLEIWGRDLKACTSILETIAARYGGACVTAGYIMRSQISVQYFLDIVKCQLDRDRARSPGLETAANACSKILLAMLLSSLSNNRFISQGEHDIAACMGALSDCSFGSVGSHVIFNAMMGVLHWAEVFHSETVQSGLDDEHKMQVANRLARNLLISQFHDVVAPMLLSRTVFSSERSTKYDTHGTSPSVGKLSWQDHWKLCLLTFSWVASVAGPDGLVASKSLGSLLLASGLAGSLKGALDSADATLGTTLFLPPPSLAMSLASTSQQNEWSYSDLLADRLHVLMPLLPGLVVSILSHPSDVTPDTLLSAKSLNTISALLDSVCGALHKVFSGLSQSSSSRSQGPQRTYTALGSTIIKAARDYVPQLLIVTMILESHILLRRSSSAMKNDDSTTQGGNDDEIQVIKASATTHITSSSVENSWMDISVETSMNGDTSKKQLHNEDEVIDLPTMIAALVSCQTSIMSMMTELLIDAMDIGGGEISTAIWRSMLSTVRDSTAYNARTGDDISNIRSSVAVPPKTGTADSATASAADDQDASTNTNTKDADGADNATPSETEGTEASTTEPPSPSQSQSQSSANQLKAGSVGSDVLSRMVALVLTKILRRHDRFEAWSVQTGAAVSRLCLMIEEKELLQRPMKKDGGMEGEASDFSKDQILLLCAILNVLAYGRDLTGWCQLILPSPPAPQDMNDPENAASGATGGDHSEEAQHEGVHGASKLMLPVLRPCTRLIVNTLSTFPSSKKIQIIDPSKIVIGDGKGNASNSNSNNTDDHIETKLLLDYVYEEMKHTVVAAIAGLSFPNARDTALRMMASLRLAMNNFDSIGDLNAKSKASSLLNDVVIEINVRYEAERRRRETALIDAYEDEVVDFGDGRGAKEEAASNAQAVEKLIMGDGLIPTSRSGDSNEEGTHGTGDNAGNENDNDSSANQAGSSAAVDNPDFVLFHDGYVGGSTRTIAENQARMEWSRYEGLGAALEECQKDIIDGGGNINDETQTPETVDTAVGTILKHLSDYMDSWDEWAAREAADAELVPLFDDKLTLVSNPEDGTREDSREVQFIQILGSETAADSMSTFIEFAALEKTRQAEVRMNFLPSHRNSCTAYAERFCWARYLEITRCGGSDMDELWERGIADGNRDIRSRLVSIPCAPQFRRYIPGYLDHSVDSSAAAAPSAGEAEADEATETEASGGDAGAAAGAGDPKSVGKEEEVSRPLQTSDVDEIDRFTKTLLETGHVEIVDITKKEMAEDEGPDISMPTEDMLDDDGLFAETPMEAPTTTESERSSSQGKLKRGDSNDHDAANGSMDGTPITDALSHDDTMDDTTIATKLGSSHFNITSSAFASPPDNSASTLSLIHSAAAGMIEQHVESCLHIKAEGTRKCSMLLTATHLILEYDPETDGLYEGELMAVMEEAERQRMIEDAGGNNKNSDKNRIKDELEARQRETAALRPRSIRWNLSELSHVYLRRYRLRDSSLEMFFIPSGGTSFGGYGLYSPATSLFIDFGPGHDGVKRRDDAAFAIMKRSPPQTIKQWPDRSQQFMHEQLSRLTIGWVEGRITNFDYLLHLNMLAGRSYNDICQYPVMPWVLSNFDSEEIPDLRDRSNYRDLTKPMGALNPDRLEGFIERFRTFADPSIPPFMYGSHYSTSAGVVLHFLVRLHPFAGLHRQLQSGHFDVADRLFSSVPRTWEMCTGSSAAEVKEITPEWYCNPAFLKNTNKFKLGTSQDGDVLGDVELPPWAKGRPETFIEVMRNALESDICSAMLPDWIDLIFGRKQQGPEAIQAHNVFFYLTYYGSVDVASIEDEGLRQATELQIAHFGQCPMQLFHRSHVRRIALQNHRRLSFYQILSAYTSGAGREGDVDVNQPDLLNRVFGEPLYLPFFSAPLSHWVHLDAPPPGPHAHLISVRLAGTDRCLAVDARGVFHCFRWAWKSAEDKTVAGARGSTFPMDSGCFVAQRELPRFRTVPRLTHVPRSDEFPAVAISKTLFAGRSVLLVLSDADGRGSLAMQLVDPAKGSVRGEAVIHGVHSAQISCIHTDPIGTAAGHGGVGGELAIVGSRDGTASIWRFMSSHYLPLRPRVRLHGHGGSKVVAVCLSASIHIATTVSSRRCCLHSVGNGNMIRSIAPPTSGLDLPDQGGDLVVDTVFADTPAVAISVQGFLVAVCETRIRSPSSPHMNRSIITLQLFSLEGVPLGSKPLETWRGVPHRMCCTPDGTAVMVCSGRGVTIHRVSAITPLEFIDEWHVTETDELDTGIPQAFDADFGPSLNRPVVAAAACSNGVLRLHALAGISPFSQRHQRGGLSQTVGFALARPARRLKTALGKGFGLGTKVVGVGKEIGKEVTTDVKERGVARFLGGVFRRASSAAASTTNTSSSSNTGS